jgi:hypothetical protein
MGDFQSPYLADLAPAEKSRTSLIRSVLGGSSSIILELAGRLATELNLTDGGRA